MSNLIIPQFRRNNGNIATQTNNVTSGRTQTYTYDPLNRLLTAQSSATLNSDCWGQSFGNGGPPPTMAADALANLFYTSTTKCSSPAPQFTVSTSHNNQFTGTGISYDSDGDMTGDTAFTYTYDAENRIRSVDVGGTYYCYIYDGNGLRVEKATASSSACSSPTAYELYWRNIDGNTIAETDGSGSTTNSSYHEYIFFAGRRIAQANPSTGSVYYYFVDHLGSTRVVTTATGSPCYEADFLPYGTENTPYGFSNTCSTNYKFTGYERDAETAYGTSSGNDYAFARYYNARLGRFMSGDPLEGDISDPQTLNKYTYVQNNAANLIDPTGMDGEDPCGDSCGGPNCEPFCGFVLSGLNGFTCPEGVGCYPNVVNPPPAIVPSTVSPPEGQPHVDSQVWGCENLGMPCGMQFPVPGGGLSGCTYGMGSCGGGVYGFTLGSAGGGTNPIWLDGFLIQVLVMEFLDRPNFALIAPQTGPRKLSLPQAQSFKKSVVNFLCGTSPSDAVWQWAKDGAIKGLVVGSVTGGVTGAVFGVGVGAPFGAVLGGITDATIGGTAGIFGGAVAAGVCYASGVYK